MEEVSAGDISVKSIGLYWKQDGETSQEGAGSTYVKSYREDEKLMIKMFSVDLAKVKAIGETWWE